MANIFGLDLGSTSLGVAIGKNIDGKIIPVVLKTIFFEQFNYKSARLQLISLITEYNVAALVFGYPLNMDGTKGKRTLSVERFVSDLTSEVASLKIIYQDERLTTVQARERLEMLGYPKKREKEYIDSVAALIILESYLSKNGEQINENK